MEQLVILIVIAAISLINWLLQKSAEHKNKRAQDGDPDGSDAPSVIEREPEAPHSDGTVQPPASETELRRFFEALGIPPQDAPPVVPKHVFASAPTPLP